MKKPAALPVFKALTREEASPLVYNEPEKCIDLLVALSFAVCQLSARVSELEAQIAKNSSNSSKPPSSDGFKKPAPKSLRTKSGKKPGGQPGHPGHNLQPSAAPNIIVLHPCPDNCPHCQRDLRGVPVSGLEKRQVFELPKPKIMVTEHQAYSKDCACGAVVKGEFPADVNAAVQYGPRTKAAATYLNQFQHIPYDRCCQAMSDLLGIQLCPGTLKNIIDESYQLLEKVELPIKQAIIDTKVTHHDETGYRINRILHWIHVVSTDSATWYTVNKKRGATAMTEAGILPQLKGVMVHDGWFAYPQFGQDHALCNAHHLRELVFVVERWQQSWAQQMIDLLLEIKHSVYLVQRTDDKPGGIACEVSEKPLSPGEQHIPLATSLSDAMRAEFERRYQTIIDQGYRENPWEKPTGKPKRGRVAKPKPLNLLERLDTKRMETLRFMTDFKVPFDNNLAERDLRMVKLRQKISGGSRSMEGAQAFCRARSFISTARKNSYEVMDALSSLWLGDPLCFIIPKGAE
jgi:transposase